jgi:YHS domain-containing protein
MIRLVFIVILAYLLYRLVKNTFGSGNKHLKGRSEDKGIIDEMVQDPLCKTYVPLRESVRRTVNGKELFFCSKECADKFEAENSK